MLRDMRINYFRKFYFMCFPFVYWVLKVAQWGAKKRDLLFVESMSGEISPARMNVINYSSLSNSDLFFFYAVAFVAIVAVYFLVPFLVRAIKKSKIENKVILVIASIACYITTTLLVLLVNIPFVKWIYGGRLPPRGADVEILLPDAFGLLSLSFYPLSFIGECLILILMGLVLSIPREE